MFLDFYFALDPASQLILFFIAQMVMSLINAWLCYIVWIKRSNRGSLSKPIDIALKGSEVGQMIIHTHDIIENYDNRIQLIEGRLDDVLNRVDGLQIPSIAEIETKIQSIRESLPSLDEFKNAAFDKAKGLLGRTVRDQNAEIKQVASDVALVEAEVNFPSVHRALHFGDELVNQGLINPETLEKVLGVAQRNPKALPWAEGILSKLINNGGNNTGTSKKGWFENG